MRKHRKPRGEMSILTFNRHGPVYLRPSIGESKEDIERHIATTFLHSPTDFGRKESALEWLGVDEAFLNDTSDFDVALKRRGHLVAYLELVEFAPLGRGATYQNASSSYDAAERAEEVYALIAKKWAKYRAVKTPIFLVVYCTEEMFMPSRLSLALVSHWLFTRPNAPCFEGVFLRSLLPAIPNIMLHARVYLSHYLDWARRVSFEEPKGAVRVYTMRMRDFQFEQKSSEAWTAASATDILRRDAIDKGQ